MMRGNPARSPSRASPSPAVHPTRTATNSASMSAITLANVSKHWTTAQGRVQGVDGLSFELEPGTLNVLLGPSGCGKSTTLRLIAGLEAADGGTIRIGGRDVTSLPPAQRSISMVFQSYALFPHLTVAENILFGLRVRKVAPDECGRRLAETASLLGLSALLARKPGQLSGGQQQRIALARALATSPGLLLLDEPLSALDAKVRERLRGEIRQLQRRLRVTTIMVTHDQEEALSMADRVVVMNHGVIEQIGPPLEVYERPATPFVADFIGKVNVLSATCVGDGRYRVGQVELAVPANGIADGRPVRLYLRPEDRVLADSGPLDGRPNRLQGSVRNVDFLGTYCLATIDVDGFDGQSMLVYFSLNQALELGVREGASIPFALRGERVRVFARD